MTYDPDELIMFRGKMASKEVLFHKVRGLGWTEATFGLLTDEEIGTVLEQRMTPAQMGKTAPAAAAPQPVVDLNSDAGSDPSIMGPPGTAPREDPPAPAGKPLESGVVPVGVAPPAHAATRLRPNDPTRPQAAQPAAPALAAAGPMRGVPTSSVPITVRPPKTDTAKLMSMLDAAFQLAQTDATVPTAKVLIATNGLDRAFQAMYPDLAKKVLGRFDTSPDPRCRGGIILDVEMEANDGYCHIITSAGVITITGHHLTHKGAEA